jgi:protein SCO1/2
MSATLTAGPPARTGARLLLLWAVAVLVWWGFAFFPAPPGDDSWLAAAQAACFGSLPGGLPAAHGWIMLTLAPLMLLATLLAAFRGELRGSLPDLRRSRGWRATALALAGLGAVEVGFAAVRVERAARVAATSFAPAIREPLPADYPRTADPVPAFTLLDQHGRAFTDAMLPGRPVVMSFVFAHCRTVCPALLRTMGSASRELGPGAGMVLVTLDPWRDTPASLASVAAGWPLPADSRFLTGEPDAVCRLLDGLGVARERDLRNGDVTHVPLVMVLDAQGRVAHRFNNPPPSWIVEAVRRLERAP